MSPSVDDILRARINRNVPEFAGSFSSCQTLVVGSRRLTSRFYCPSRSRKTCTVEKYIDSSWYNCKSMKTEGEAN